MSGQPGGSNRVRYFGGDREEMVEEEDDDTVSLRYQGLKEATGDQVVQRAIMVKRSTLRASAVCATVLCVLLAAGIIAVSMYYHAANSELQTKYDNLTLERDHLQSEVNQLTAVKSCPSGWMKVGDSCYYRSAELKTWEEHRELCLNTGADLVIINSKEEQEFITGLTYEDKYVSWLGLKRTGGNWTWVDGTPLTTQYWGSGKPLNNGDDNCAYHGKEVWSNEACVKRAFRVCEK